MNNVTVGKSISFAAAHYLHNTRLTNDENRALFHKCSGVRADTDQLTPHGHNYRLAVDVRGVPDPISGYVIDFKELKQILQDTVMATMDHRCISMEVQPFRSDPTLPATVENLSIVIWNLIAPKINTERRHMVELRLWETDDSYAVYRGAGNGHA